MSTLQEHYDREDRMKEECDRRRDEAEEAKDGGFYGRLAAKACRERDEADAYILSLWRANLLPRPMPESLRDRLAEKKRFL